MDVGVRKQPVQERSQRIPHVDPVLHQPRNRNQRRRQTSPRQGLRTPLPQQQSHHIEHRRKARILDREAEPRRQTHRHRQPPTGLGIRIFPPDLSQVKRPKRGRGQGNIVIGGRTRKPRHRRQEHQQRSPRTCRRMPDSLTIAEDQQRQRQQETALYGSRRRLPSKGKCVQEQHLHSQRHVGIKARRDPVKAVLPKEPIHQPQMISLPIGTILRGHRVHQIDKRVNPEYGEPPGPRPLHPTGNFHPVIEVQRHPAHYPKRRSPHQPQRAQPKHQQAQQRRPHNACQHLVLQPAQPNLQAVKKYAPQSPRRCHREPGTKQNGQGAAHRL